MREQIKKLIEDATGIAKPRVSDLVVRKRMPLPFRFRDDGETPNNAKYPLIVYRSAVKLDRRYDPAAIFEVLFGAHKWKGSWRDIMYGFNHFHTRTHECLGIARGTLTALFGGGRGRKIALKAGDVVVIPAGVGHKHVRQSKDLLIVGAYPSNAGKYDEPKPGEIDHDEALRRIRKIARPATDPVYGKGGPLFSKWRAA